METVLSELAKARKYAREHNERFVRISLPVLADVVAALLGAKVSEESEADNTKKDTE
jgi:hypothetical protein